MEKRKLVQIISGRSDGKPLLYGLCDDGTVWEAWHCEAKEISGWDKINTDDINKKLERE